MEWTYRIDLGCNCVYSVREGGINKEKGVIWFFFFLRQFIFHLATAISAESHFSVEESQPWIRIQHICDTYTIIEYHISNLSIIYKNQCSPVAQLQ